MMIDACSMLQPGMNHAAETRRGVAMKAGKQTIHGHESWKANDSWIDS